MKTRLPLFAATALMIGALTAVAQETNQGGQADGRGNRPLGMPGRAGTGGAGTTGNGINYNGGPVLLNTVHIYYIWYGTWDAASMAIPVNFANAIGGSPYFNINTTYFDSANNNVSGLVTYNGSTADNYSLGTSLTDSSMRTIVTSALTSGRLPTDTNGVYFVLTSPDVNDTSGFTTQFCGWHTWATINGANIKYSFVGNSSQINAGACSVQTTKSPNGNPGVDAMVSVIAHELEETTTDPNLNAWFDSAGNENADKCAWTFGTTYTAANGSSANVNLGGHDFLIQQNWVNAAGGLCAMSYNPTPDFSIGVSPSSQSVLPGGTTGSYTVTVTPASGFTGTVDFTVAGLPGGASTNPAPLASSTTSTSFTITTLASLAPGNYPFTITGKNGTLTHTINATLVVLQPDFTLTVAPSSQTVVQGGTTASSYVITVHPVNGFSGAVNFSVTGLPAGATTNPNPLASSATTSSFTVTVPASASTGNYTLTIKGVNGTLNHTATATLVVNPSGTFTITVSPNPLTVRRGNTGNYTVTIVPTGGFNSQVQLSVSGLPSKSTGSFTVNPVPGGSTSSTLKITVQQGAKTSSGPITVTGTSGSLSAQGTATLTITN